MSLLNRNNFILDEDEEQSYMDYNLPKLAVTKPEVIPIGKSFAISTALHPIVVFLIWLIIAGLSLLGINLILFNKPPAKIKKDIEFVLVDKEGMPRDPHTRNRADINSRSGGIRDPKRPVSMPSPAPKKAAKPSASASSANKIIKKQQQKAAQQKTQAKSQPAKSQSKASQHPSATNTPSPAKPAPPTARPSARPISAPEATSTPSSPFTTARPANAPTGKTLATGPVGGTSAPTGASRGGSGTGGSTTGAGTGAPKPSLSPSSSGGTGSLGRSGGGSGNGSMGNPGGGGGAPGIDALKEPDFGPYMRELQRRIKMNWDPPKGNESKRVVLLFKIAKDGRLISCRVHKSSGLPSADQAALKAVELTAPFRPLPADFKGANVDIQFTFDYNVFNATRY